MSAMSATGFEIVPATHELGCQIAADMLAEDAEEVFAAGGYSPLGAVEAALSFSVESKVLLIDKQPAALWGVAPAPGHPKVGVVWLLCTTRVRAHKPIFWAAAYAALADMHLRYAVLFNMVDARYTSALRFVQKLGFEIGPAQSFGVQNRMFHMVRSRRNV